jgi:hypothetical protein
VLPRPLRAPPSQPNVTPVVADILSGVTDAKAL